MKISEVGSSFTQAHITKWHMSVNKEWLLIIYNSYMENVGKWWKMKKEKVSFFIVYS